MGKVFVNFTNHPLGQWDEEQIEGARKYGDIVDLDFPNVDAAADEGEIRKLARECVDKILKLQPTAVLCQGEFCLAYQVITLLKEKNITVLAACSERNVKECSMPGQERKKEVIYRFRRFREY